MDEFMPNETGGCQQHSCDTSTNSPHMVSFTPQAAAASNCNYFATVTPRMQNVETAILWLKNPSPSNTTLYVTIESISNYGAKPVVAYLAKGLTSDEMITCEAEITSTNLGCQKKSAVKGCYTGLNHHLPLCKIQYLTQDIAAPLSTLRIDHKGGFLITPGTSLAIIVEGLFIGCIDVGIDFRWWETPSK